MCFLYIYIGSVSFKFIWIILKCLFWLFLLNRDVIKWLFCVIMKTTENEDSKEGIKIKDEQIRYKNKTLNKNLLLFHSSLAFCTLTFWLHFVPCRIVSVFQRMLSLALEVDRSPALNSAKLSHELFHMVLSHMPLRAHR